MRRFAIGTAAALVTVSAAACGGGNGTSRTPSTPTTPSVTNHNPTVTASVSPTFGIDSLTTFTFSASASDADGDSLTYSWRIGNGTYNQQTVRLYFIGGGSSTGQVTVTDGTGGSGTASTQTFTVGSMTGTWRGSWSGYVFNMKLEQVGGTVTGTYSDQDGAGRTDPAEPGSITASGKVVLRIKQAAFRDFIFTGQMDRTGRRVTGTVKAAGGTIAFTMDKL